MRVVVRTSRLAIWARRLALFAVALLLVAAGLRFFGQISWTVFEISIAIGTLAAALGVLCGFCAYVWLWFTGDRGWGYASAGFVLGMIGLAPAGAAAVIAELYPSTIDVTTALADPPPLQVARPDEETRLDTETILASYPNLITRIYQVPPDILFALGEDLARASGWIVIDTDAPAAADASGRLNAIRPAPFGWESEIAFRVAPGNIGGALIDLRAAALEPVRHDLGENGRAIEAFLLALDDRVSGFVQQYLSTIEEEETFEVIDALEGDVQPSVDQ